MARTLYGTIALYLIQLSGLAQLQDHHHPHPCTSPPQDKRLSLSRIPSVSKRQEGFCKMVQKEINRRRLRKRTEVSQSEQSEFSLGNGTAPPSLPPLPFLYRQYPPSIVRLQFYRGTPLLRQDFWIRLKKEKRLGKNTHCTGEPGRREPGWGAGPVSATLGPLQGGARGCRRLPRCRNPAAAARAGPPVARGRPPQ